MEASTSAASYSISAIVLCYNSSRHIEKCVRSLAAAFSSIPGNHEIWVVENGSRDDSAAILRDLEREFSALLHVIYETENTGTTRSRNRAIRSSTGQHIAIMDADATIDAVTLDALVTRLTADPGIGIAAPRLVYPDGRHQLSTDTFPTFGRKLNRLLRLRALENASAIPTAEQDVDCVISAVWVMPRGLFEDIGLLDENIFYSPEDVDLCLRTWKAGLRVMYYPDLIAVHDARELSRNFKFSMFFFRHVAGLLYYFKKHRYFLSRRRIYKMIDRARGERATRHDDAE